MKTISLRRCQCPRLPLTLVATLLCAASYSLYVYVAKPEGSSPIAYYNAETEAGSDVIEIGRDVMETGSDEVEIGRDVIETGSDEETMVGSSSNFALDSFGNPQSADSNKYVIFDDNKNMYSDDDEDESTEDNNDETDNNANDFNEFDDSMKSDEEEVRWSEKWPQRNKTYSGAVTGLTTKRPFYLNAHNLHWTISEAGKYSSKLFTPPTNEAPKQRYPTAIIFGVGKCGTRALLEFMRMHPYITATGPEIHFFDSPTNFQRGFDWYLSKMPISYSNQITLEKTPAYIWSKTALDEIYKLNKDMKLIVILKDPVIRLVSTCMKEDTDKTSLRDYLTTRDGVLRVDNASRNVYFGRYALFLQHWLKKFSKSQIHIVEAMEFTHFPTTELQKIEDFLGVPKMITERNFWYNSTKGFYCQRPFYQNDTICLGEGKGKPHPKQDPEVMSMFYDFYKSHNEELFSLIGRRFDWWQKDENDVIG